jgi:hypothetical protein
MLGIIAGLIITDLVKAVVGTIGPGPTWATFYSYTFALSAASLLFVTRVLIDNALYYTRPDAKTLYPAYVARLFLIIVDLLSYSLCYFIVVQVERLDAAGLEDRLRAICYAVVAVEALHLIWCLVALVWLKIPPDSADYTPRRSWLKKWAGLSGAFAVLGTIALVFAYHQAWSERHWLRFLVVFSILSVGAYGTFMKAEYLGNWKAERSADAEATNARPVTSGSTDTMSNGGSASR